MDKRQRVTIRLDADVVERIDRYSEAAPGILGRNQGIEALLLDALDRWENPQEQGQDLASMVGKGNAQILAAVNEVKALLGTWRQPDATPGGNLTPGRGSADDSGNQPGANLTPTRRQPDAPWTPERIKRLLGERSPADLAAAIGAATRTVERWRDGGRSPWKKYWARLRELEQEWAP